MPEPEFVAMPKPNPRHPLIHWRVPMSVRRRAEVSDEARETSARLSAATDRAVKAIEALGARSRRAVELEARIIALIAQYAVTHPEVVRDLRWVLDDGSRS